MVERHVRIGEGLIWMFWVYRDIFVLKEAWIEWFEDVKTSLNWIGLDFSVLNVHMHTWKNKAHLSSNGYDFSGWRAQNHNRDWEGSFELCKDTFETVMAWLNWLRVHRHLWDQDGSFEGKWFQLEWIENATRGVHSLLYFAHTCVMDPFIGGLFTLQKIL